MICEKCQALLDQAAERLQASGSFAEIEQAEGVLTCHARDVEEEAYYRAEIGEDRQSLIVGLYTPNRWLSESIEADLLHTGDKMEELLEEELVDQGYEGSLAIQHFRDDEKRFVFMSDLPVPSGEPINGSAMLDRLTKVMLAYEACFRELGDMQPEEE